MEEEDLCANNRNKRKFQDEILEVHVSAKHACLESAKDSNSLLDSVMSAVSHDSTSPSSSVNWSGPSKTCDDISTSTLYTFPCFDDCEFSSSQHEEEEEEETKQSMQDLLCSNAVISSNSVLSSGRWNLNQDAEQASEKLTIDKEFEQYFSMLML